VSGLVKLLHPHGEWTHGELREYLEFAGTAVQLATIAFVSNGSSSALAPLAFPERFHLPGIRLLEPSTGESLVSLTRAKWSRMEALVNGPAPL
jgi:hypothetical protein